MQGVKKPIWVKNNGKIIQWILLQRWIIKKKTHFKVVRLAAKPFSKSRGKGLYSNKVMFRLSLAQMISTVIHTNCMNI